MFYCPFQGASRCSHDDNIGRNEVFQVLARPNIVVNCVGRGGRGQDCWLDVHCCCWAQVNDYCENMLFCCWPENTGGLFDRYCRYDIDGVDACFTWVWAIEIEILIARWISLNEARLTAWNSIFQIVYLECVARARQALALKWTDEDSKRVYIRIWLTNCVCIGPWSWRNVDISDCASDVHCKGVDNISGSWVACTRLEYYAEPRVVSNVTSVTGV